MHYFWPPNAAGPKGMSMFLCLAVLEVHTLEQCTVGYSDGYGEPHHLTVWHCREHSPTGKRYWDIHNNRAPSPASASARKIQRGLNKNSCFFPLENISKIKIISILTETNASWMSLEKLRSPRLSRTHPLSSCSMSSTKEREQKPSKGTGGHKGQFDPGFDTNRLCRVCTAFPLLALWLRSCLILYWLCISHLQPQSRLLE